MTKAVVAMMAFDSPTEGVGAFGVPVKTGELIGANEAATNAVVAIRVLFVPGFGVGAVGVPLNAGLAKGASVGSWPLIVAKLALIAVTLVFSDEI